MKKINVTDLFLFVISTELIGALSGLLSGNFSDFYGNLNKPAFAPDGLVFPIVWGILYALMGISAYLIFNSDKAKPKKKKALIIYAVQLFVNFSWSIVFFRFRMIGLSIAVILVLIILVAGMIYNFKRISPLAAYINIPYLLWIIFAAYLNIAIQILN